MKRNHYFAYKILNFLEVASGVCGANISALQRSFELRRSIENDEHAIAKLREELSYHLRLLNDSGLIALKSDSSGDFYRLTWTGHDQLDSYRDDAASIYIGSAGIKNNTAA